MIAVAESTEERLRELYPGRMGTVLVRLQSRDKRPIDQGWNRQAAEAWANQIDPAPIVSALAAHIDAGGNVGWAVPPGLLVLDADDETSAGWLCEVLPDAPRQRSRKGVHLVVKAPAGVDLRQVTELEIADGIRVDLRTPGRGQIAVEPSIHPTGFAYHWEIELPLDIDQIPDLPEGITARLRNVSSASNTININEASWREGSRESRLVSMAGHLRRLGMHEEEIRGALAAVNLKRCAPVLPPKDIERIARSAGKWDRGGEAEKPDPPAVDELAGIFFSGQKLLDLLNEPAPDPVYPGVPPAGHFSLLIAPSFSGKTSLALWQAMAQIRGAAPWQGAPQYRPGRVLFYSIDEPPGQVAHRLRALAVKHPAGRFVTDYADGITIAGPHPSVDPDQLEQLRFTEEGLHVLDGLLGLAASQGRAYSLVIVDAYSDLLPLGESDSSNEEATRIGGALERLAVTYGCAIQVIHHAGKPVVGADLPDPRDYGRGASALAAKARAIFTLEEEPGMPNVRKIRTRTNLTTSPGPFLLDVSDNRGEGGTRIDYFRPHDSVAAYPINAYLTVEDDWISVTQLARRLAGDGDDPDKKPSGSLLRQARELRGIWDNAGLVEVRTGARNALELRRV